jgi:hypothetical protein
MSGHLPSEGVHEDIEAVPVKEKNADPTRDLAQEEDYDDTSEPEEDHGQGEEEEEEEAGALLSPTGVHLCVLGSIALFLLYCSHTAGDLSSDYI